VCRSFRETHFYYDRIRLFFFFVRAYAYALGGAAEMDARESSRNTTSVVARLFGHILS